LSTIREANGDEIEKCGKSEKVNWNMKTFKNLHGLAMIGMVGLGMTAATSYAQQNWDYSYTFGDGVKVNGTFEGYQAGNFVDNISDITMDVNGTPVSGPITIDTYDNGNWVPGAVVSFTATDNNFLFWDSANLDNWLYVIPGEANVDFPQLGVSEDYDAPAVNASWTLVDPPSVPDGGSTAMLCGMSLVALGWIRRKLA
jgi:hypothetical protein